MVVVNELSTNYLKDVILTKNNGQSVVPILYKTLKMSLEIHPPACGCNKETDAARHYVLYMYRNI